MRLPPSLPAMGVGHAVKRVPASALARVAPLVAPGPISPILWREEHNQFVKNMQAMKILDDDALAETKKLESIVYFDQEHGHIVMRCSYCMEILICTSHIFDKEHTCHSCNKQQTAQTAVDAAYLSLLGVMHPNCVLSEPAFQDKTQGISADELVRKSKEAGSYARHSLDKKRNLAERKALKLIQILFGNKVYKQLVKTGETWIKGADRKFYRIFWARHGNVAVYQHRYKSQARRAGKDWRPISVYCGHFGEEFPIGDQIITQICMLQTNPEKYTDQANAVDGADWRNCGPLTAYHRQMQDIMAVEL